MRRTRVSFVSVVLLALLTPVLSQQPARRRQGRGAARPRPPAERQAAGAPVRSYKEIKYPTLGKLNVPQPARFELPNGMVVFLLEDHTLPTVGMEAMIRAGTRWEPVEKAGLAALTGAVMRTGGTKSRGGDELDEELDRLGAVVETSVGDEAGRAFVSVLKEDADRGLTILADVLRNPRFPEDKLELAKLEQRDAIARRNDDPAGIAFREFNRIIYGPNSAYGHIPQYSTLKAIDRDDLVNFHRQYFQPENVILGIWGDLDANDMRRRVEQAFGGWPRGGRPRPAPPEVDPAARGRGGLYFISKEDINQSWVLIGGLGGRRDDPDFYALQVMNTVLGGGFSSRLFSRVRSQEGLAYAVWSDWAAGWDRPGTFMAAGGTKSETTTKILEAMRREIVSVATSGVTDEELSRAKDAILKGFAFEFDSTGKIVRRVMGYEYYGYPADYLQRYTEGIQKVTRGDVQRVAREHLKPDQFVILVLGNEKTFDRPLSSLGQVTNVDVSIPPEGK